MLFFNSFVVLLISSQYTLLDKVFRNNSRFIRMVLEPKFVDYGSIHPTPDGHTHQVHHGVSGPRSALLSPLDDEDVTANASAGPKMTQGDLYQRQPLLPNPKNGDHWAQHTHGTTGSEYYVDEEDEIMDKGSNRNGDIIIDIPASREEPRFPQERWKTLLAFVIMCFNFILTLTSLSLVHDKVPDRKVYGPLPDVFLLNVPAYDWALDVSEYIIIFCVNSCMITMIFHKHRFIVFRRIFLIMSLLYMYRAITMYVTVLPLSSTTYVCSPTSNDTSPSLIMKRVLHLMSGFGLSVNGKHTYCGDFIYSGHTVVLVFSYLVISEYTPKKFFLLRIVHWLYWILGLIGVIMLQLSHGHYTVDVIIAYYVTTRIFWIYHTLANNANLKQFSSNNLLSRTWWFALFLYFEGNVGGPIPRQFDWPLPWPRRWHSKGNRAS
uniref:Sphingomyelin synthase-like domain-containing protein n=1 Tax=Dendroctonus ponderosae TaxID=77166 RepID=A0AAR5QI07_DENPD